MKRKAQGFGLVEVLIAVAFLAVVLGSIVTNNIRLAELNTRAEVQAAEASAAEGLAQLYVDDVPNPGEMRSGRVSEVLPLASTSAEDKAVWNVLQYQLHRSGDTLNIDISRRDVTPDPNPLHIEVKL